jgi:carboxylesterase type B
VLVFLHGGNFRQGFNGGGVYDFGSLANSTDSVVVVPQYRLGAFGFLVAAETNLAGNYGILDQRWALQWIQNNIGVFGGDKTRVTIAGQSAGGCSVAVHLVDAHARGLFSQAILESPSCLSLPLRSPEEAQWLGGVFTKNISCSTLDCLQSKSAEEVLAAQLASANSLWVNRRHLLELFQPFEPTYGTADTTLSGMPLEQIKRGDWAQVAVMAGTVTDEAVPFIYDAFRKPMRGVEALALLDVVFGPNSARELTHQLYPLRADDADARETVIALVTDFIFTCAVRNFTMLVAKQNPPPATRSWAFRYGHVSPSGQQVWGPNYPFCWNRCCHAAEIPICYDTAKNLAPINQDETVLTSRLSAYWGNFVRTGNPNAATAGTGLPPWLPQSATLPVNLYMDVGQLLPESARGQFCDFWDARGYQTY